MTSDKNTNTLRFLILPGDGIGPEISAAARRVLESAEENLALGFSFEEAEIGFAALEACGTTFYAVTSLSCVPC
jgi:isocitrate/isopropylmalate dehydrogenase